LAARGEVENEASGSIGVFTDFIDASARSTMLELIDAMGRTNASVQNNAAYRTSFRLWQQWIRFTLGEPLTADSDVAIETYTPLDGKSVKGASSKPTVKTLTEETIDTADFWSATQGRFKRDTPDDPNAPVKSLPPFSFKDEMLDTEWNKFQQDLSNMFAVRDTSLSDQRERSLWRLYSNGALAKRAAIKWSFPDSAPALSQLASNIVHQQWLPSDNVTHYSLANSQLVESQYGAIADQVHALMLAFNTDFNITIPAPFASKPIDATSTSASPASVVFAKFVRANRRSTLIAMPEFYAQVAFCVSLLCTVTTQSPVASANVLTSAAVQCLKFNLLGATLYDAIESSMNNIKAAVEHDETKMSESIQNSLSAETRQLLTMLSESQRATLLASLLKATQTTVSEKATVSMIKSTHDKATIDAWTMLMQKFQPNTQPPFIIHVPLIGGNTKQQQQGSAVSSPLNKQYSFWNGSLSWYQTVFGGLTRAIAVRLMLKDAKTNYNISSLDQLHRTMMKRELDASFLFWHCVWSAFLQHSQRLSVAQFEQTCSQRLFIATFSTTGADWFVHWNTLYAFVQQQKRDAETALVKLTTEQVLLRFFETILH
jgi:hypothetical protein